MMHTAGGVIEPVYGSLMRIKRGSPYCYQYRVLVGVSNLEIVTV